MADDHFMTGVHPEIEASMEELMPIIDQRFAQAVGPGRQVSFVLFAVVEDEGGVNIAVNNDDPQDVVMALLQYGSVLAKRLDEWKRKNQN